MEITIQSEKEIENELKSPKAVVFITNKVTCSFCRIIAPVIREASIQCDEVKWITCELSTGLDIASFLSKYSVKALPTLLFFKDGTFIMKQVGFLPIDNLKEIVKSIF